MDQNREGPPLSGTALLKLLSGGYLVDRIFDIICRFIHFFTGFFQWTIIAVTGGECGRANSTHCEQQCEKWFFH